MSTIQETPLEFDTIHSSRCKVGSISSMLRNEHTERHGFRRMARSLWTDLSARRIHSGHVSSNNALAQLVDPESYSWSQRHFNPWRSKADEADIELFRKQLGKETGSSPSSRNSRGPLSQYDNNTMQAPLAEPLKRPVNMGKRVLVFKKASPFVGIKSVLAQVCGGPLQKCVVNSRELTAKELSVELWFLKPEHLEDFFQFTRSGLFLVNGFHHYVGWGDQHDALGSYHEPPPKEIEQLMTEHEASRCLVMKKYVRKAKTPARYYPLPAEHFSPLNVSQIRRDLEQFGDIVEVCPMISKKLCLSVQFFDVESAILAKRALDSTEHRLGSLYKDWSVFYGKDVTDKPVVHVD